MSNLEERIEQAESIIEVLLHLIAKSSSSPLAKFVEEGLTGRKRDVLTLISKGMHSQQALANKLGVSGSAIRKYIAECDQAFREFVGMEESDIELITSPGKGEGWKTTTLGEIIISIKESSEK